MRFLYFSALLATAYWLAVLLWRKFLAVQSANVIVESPERNKQIQALENSWTADLSDQSADDEL